MECFLLSSDAETELKIPLSRFLGFSDGEDKHYVNNYSETQHSTCTLMHIFYKENLVLVLSGMTSIR